MPKVKRRIENIGPTLKTGITGDFWKIIKNALEESIFRKEKELQDNDLSFRKLPPGEYKFRSELIKSEIRFLRDLRNLPEVLIENNGILEEEEEDFDPYDKENAVA